MCGIFDKFDQIPVWTVENGNAVCRDARTGKLLQASTLSNEFDLEVMGERDVRLLVDIDWGNGTVSKKGEILQVQMMPNGTIYLMSGITCIKQNPVLNVDVELV